MHSFSSPPMKKRKKKRRVRNTEINHTHHGQVPTQIDLLGRVQGCLLAVAAASRLLGGAGT
jgi:hypothetical protein